MVAGLPLNRTWLVTRPLAAQCKYVFGYVVWAMARGLGATMGAGKFFGVSRVILYAESLACVRVLMEIDLGMWQGGVWAVGHAKKHENTAVLDRSSPPRMMGRCCEGWGVHFLVLRIDWWRYFLIEVVLRLIWGLWWMAS